MGGAGDSDWHRLATSTGRFGVYGTGRDFRTADKQGIAAFSGLQDRHVHGPVLITGEHGSRVEPLDGREYLRIAAVLGAIARSL